MTEKNDTLTAEIARKLVETLGLDMAADAIDPTTPLIGAGLGIDSIDTLELVVMIERDYGVKIDNKEAGKQVLINFETLASYIAQSRQ